MNSLVNPSKSGSIYTRFWRVLTMKRALIDSFGIKEVKKISSLAFGIYNKMQVITNSRRISQWMSISNTVHSTGIFCSKNIFIVQLSVTYYFCIPISILEGSIKQPCIFQVPKKFFSARKKFNHSWFKILSMVIYGSFWQGKYHKFIIFCYCIICKYNLNEFRNVYV